MKAFMFHDDCDIALEPLEVWSDEQNAQENVGGSEDWTDEQNANNLKEAYNLLILGSSDEILINLRTTFILFRPN